MTISIDWHIPALLACVVVAIKLSNSKRRPPFPPGPPADPLIGNVRSMPLKDEDIYFYELGKEYGDIVHMDLLGSHLIVLNSTQVASELLDKRSSVHSGRPRVPLVQVLGFDTSFVFSDYGSERFQLHRRLTQRYLVKENISSTHYRSRWVEESSIMVRRLASDPELWDSNLLSYAIAIVLELGCGHRVTSNSDPYLQLTSGVCKHAVPVLKPPEGSAVDLFPILKYLPSWFPGGYWVGRARIGRKYLKRFEDFLLADAIDRMGKGIAKPSFIVDQLEALRDGTADPAVDMDHLKSMLTTLYLAGVETTASTLSMVIAALVLYPECQVIAQEEIDRVVGSSRLPDFSDKPSLPYLDALINEVQRWRPVLPLGVAHTAMSDDIYNGMFIPKGSILLANVRAMGLDARVYREPEKFYPPRFLPEPHGWGEPPLNSNFGFGRRICPGRFLAEETVWIAIATLLATCHIQRPINPEGKEYTPTIIFEPGLASHPGRFPLRVQYRTSEAQELLDQNCSL